MKLGTLFMGFRKYRPKSRLKTGLKTKPSVGNPASSKFVGPPMPRPKK